MTMLCSLLFALGISPLSADTPNSCHYEPRAVIHIKAEPQELEIAKRRNELATLLIEALKDEANRKTDQKREARIQRLLRQLQIKETK